MCVFFFLSHNFVYSKQVFKQKPTKQKNVIIAIVICGAVLLVVVIGTVLGVVLTQKSK